MKGLDKMAASSTLIIGLRGTLSAEKDTFVTIVLGIPAMQVGLRP